MMPARWVCRWQAARGFRRDDRGVSDVVGSILLVGITVAMVTGLSVVVLAVDPPQNDRFTDLASRIDPGSGDWGEGDESVRILHMGGQPWPRDEARIRVAINGVITEFTGAGLTGGFADGTLTIGETWNATFTIPVGADVALDAIDTRLQIIVTSANLVPSAATGGSLPSAANPTYASSFTATTGSVSDFNALRSANDGNATATLSESTLSAPDVYATNAAGSATDRLEATGAPDDVRATLASNGDNLVTTGFAAGTGTIDTVHVVVEARASGILINDQLDVYYDDGTTHFLGAIDLTGSDQEYTFNITADKAAWTWSDITGLDLETQYDKVQSPDLVDFQVDALYVRMGLSGNANALDVHLDFPAPVSGASHSLELRYAASGDAFHVEVWNGTAWNPRGATLDQGGLTEWTYALAPDEVRTISEAPRIRFIDDTPDGPTQGLLELDYVRVRAS